MIDKDHGPIDFICTISVLSTDFTKCTYQLAQFLQNKLQERGTGVGAEDMVTESFKLTQVCFFLPRRSLLRFALCCSVFLSTKSFAEITLVLSYPVFATNIECSGQCEAGHWCNEASASLTQNRCGGPNVYCPLESPSPIYVRWVISYFHLHT